MKRLLSSSVIVLSLLSLAACGSTSGTTSYRVIFDKRLDPAKKQEIAVAASHVIQRRVDAMKGLTKNAKIEAKDTEAVLSVNVSPATLIDPLTNQLAESLDLRLMRSTNPGEAPDVTVQGNRNFTNTGISEKDILWVTSGPMPDDKVKGSVLIRFNKEGAEKVKKVFKTTRGKQVALFLRGRLISSFLNSTGEARENILIDGVPTVELAAAFADDVNVGTFTKIVPNR